MRLVRLPRLAGLHGRPGQEDMNQTIVHLSDIHYGPPFQRALEPILLSEIEAAAPDLVVLSGDLTQRARKRQFQEATGLLARLPRPTLVLPGNHDVPLYNVFDRLFRSLERYRRCVRPEVDMTVRSDGLLAVGLNSAFGWTNDRGRLTKAQLLKAEETFAAASPTEFKLFVTHHHFVCPPGVHQGPLPEALLGRFAGWGVELVLCGHTHLTHVERRPEGLVLLQAGTATASRWKKLAKCAYSFNVIVIEADQIAIQVREYDATQQTYAPAAEYVFPRKARRPEAPAIMGDAVAVDRATRRFPR
jgi:3',5'-cyclic AMP phosphodiesterase CpdA